MKTKNILTVGLIAIMSCFSSGAFAQEKIAAFIKKCESMDNVGMDVIQRRDPATKKLTQEIITIKISNNKPLIDELLNAFAADKENSSQAIDTKKNGKLVPSFYNFKDVSYSVEIRSDKNATITVIIK